jgi:hypothetical protein
VFDELSDLTILRDQLTRALEQIDIDEQRLRDDLQPQTVEEIREFEDKLTAAVEDLRRRRAELEADPKH